MKPTSGSPAAVRARTPLRFARVAIATIGLGALAVTLEPGRAEADIFVYTDKDGVMHFSNRAAGDPRFQLYMKGTGSADPRSSRAARARSREKGGVVPSMPSDRSLERFTRYDTWIRQAATLYQIPEELVRAVIKCESDFDPRAVSPVGAQGLMQLMPETALRMGVRDASDPRENIFGGTRYLRVLANLFNGDLDLTVAAYNAGEAAVMRYEGIPPYDETQAYVIRVRTYYARYRTIQDVAAASIEL